MLFTAPCRYNKGQIETRNSVERASGVCKRHSACLKTKLQTEKYRSVAITAYAALHNVAYSLRDPCPDGQGAEPEDSDPGSAGSAAVMQYTNREIENKFLAVNLDSSFKNRHHPH